MFGSNYSLADIAAATGKNGTNDGFGGDGWWIILLFLFSGFGWGGGYGRGGAGGATTTREEISYGFDMNGLENGIRGIQQGLCDGFYAMNTSMLTGFNGIQNSLTQGFAGINQAVTADTIAAMQNTNVITNGIHDLGTQLAACCCDLRTGVERGFSDLGYALATQECATRQAITDSTRDIIATNNAGVRSILDFLTQDKIATLTAENQSLKFAASQQAQNAYLVGALKDPCPIPAYVVPNPNCCTNYYGTNFGGNCGNGLNYGF
jgi:hypothetical protein